MLRGQLGGQGEQITGWHAKRLWLHSWQTAIFSFPLSTQAQRTHWTPKQRLSMALWPGVNWSKGDIDSYLVMTLRMCGTIPLLPPHVILSARTRTSCCPNSFQFLGRIWRHHVKARLWTVYRKQPPDGQ